MKDFDPATSFGEDWRRADANRHQVRLAQRARLVGANRRKTTFVGNSWAAAAQKLPIPKLLWVPNFLFEAMTYFLNKVSMILP